jgi:predicted transcriptional regulator
LYEVVRRVPGIAGREVERRAGTARGETVYHLDRLVEAGLLNRELGGHQDHYFVATVPLGDRSLLRLARSPSARRLMVSMLQEPELTVPDLERRTGLSPARLSVHLRRMIDARIVACGRRDRLRTFSIVDRERVVRVLVSYREGYADRWVEGLLETWPEVFPP